MLFYQIPLGLAEQMPVLHSENNIGQIDQLPISLEGIKISSKREKELKQFQKKLHYKFKNLNMLEKALIHPSFTRFNHNFSLNNERLEFLGDAILNLIVSDYMMRIREGFSEGILSNVRSGIVNKASLYQVALDLNIPEIINVGKNERDKNVHLNPSILANSIEAIIAAIYLDSNFDSVYKVVCLLIKKTVEEKLESEYDENYKGTLQQFVQKEYKTLPEYTVESEDGPCHEKIYTISCSILNEKYAVGKGNSKKVAEQNAAQKTLEMLKEM
ncbi:MAG: ribonuclease III [Nitrospinae bacterium]|nr:ribonuclease III [Nitrospinota bacterium]